MYAWPMTGICGPHVAWGALHCVFKVFVTCLPDARRKFDEWHAISRELALGGLALL